MCCVALCQYIEATKFRDGAKGKLASKGNPPTTHTFPISAWAPLQPSSLSPTLSRQTFPFQLLNLLFFLKLISATVWEPSLFFPSVCVSLVILPPPGSSVTPRLSYSSCWGGQTAGWCLTITSSFVSLPHSKLSLFLTLWMTSALPGSVHHFCLTLGSNRTFYDCWCFHLCIATKAVTYIRLLHTDFSLNSEKSVLVYVINLLCYLVEINRWRGQLYMMRYNLSVWGNALNVFDFSKLCLAPLFSTRFWSNCPSAPPPASGDLLIGSCLSLSLSVFA